VRQPVEFGGTLVLLAEQGPGTKIGKQVRLGTTAERLAAFAATPAITSLEEMRSPVAKRLQRLWNDENGQDIAEYAVMLAVILVIVVGTIRLIGSNANNVFSQVGSAIQ
jgi:Flp pilus assembly pilin Flp